MAAGKDLPGGPRGGAFERPKERAGVTLRRLWRYLFQYKWMLVLAVLLSVGGNLLALVGPKLSGYAIDAIKPGPGQVDFQTVFYFAALMLLFYLFSAVFSYILAALMVRLSRNIVYRLRKDVYDHLMQLPVHFFDSYPIGNVLSTLSYDIDTVNTSLSNDLVQVLASIITVGGSFFMMLSISPILILIFVVTIPASIVFTKYRSKRVRPLYRRRSEKLGELNGYAEEMTGGLKTIKVYGREANFQKRFEERNTAASQANYEADSFACMAGPTVNFMSNLSLMLVSVFGALLYMGGGITLGGVSSFVLYCRKFSGPINEFANIISELQSALAAAERIFRLLDQQAEVPDAPGALELKHVRGAVEMQDVCFGYGEKPVLQHFSMSAQPGQTVAIVGPTGAGKTTIINLLMRFYDPDAGVITVDGKDIRSLTRASLRRAYSMVLQDTWLFTGTVLENLAYGKECVSKEEVEAAAKAAKIDGFIRSLPQGYDTVLQDGGMEISKGQKQLLTIARAMLLDAPMLILDEATSNVDTGTERAIQAAMLTLMQGRTCFVIAHRLSTIQNADQIIVLQNGAAAECGTHQELMDKGGYYRSLYQAQFDTGKA